MKEKLDVRDYKNLAGTALISLVVTGFSYTLINTYLSFFYTEYALVSAASVGVVLSLGMILDGVSDFVMGYIVDRVTTKYGKAKHWFLWMGIPTGITMALVFCVPLKASSTFKLIYLFIVYNLYCCALTAIRVPSQSLVSLCSDKSGFRKASSFIIGLFGSIGNTIVSVLVAPIVGMFAVESDGYRNCAFVFAACIGILSIFAFVLIKEKKAGAVEGEEALSENDRKLREIGILGQLKLLLKNKYWDLQEIGVLGNALSIGFMLGSLSYFVNYVLGDMSKISIVFTVMSAGGLIGMGLAVPVIAKFSAKTNGILSSVLQVVGIGIAVFGMYVLDDFQVIMGGIFVKQLGSSIYTTIQLNITSLTVDYGYKKFKVRQDGMAFCGTLVMLKIGSALASAVLGFILTGAGYVGGMADIPGTAISAIKICFLVIPLIMSLIALVAFCFFDLSNEKLEKM